MVSHIALVIFDSDTQGGSIFSIFLQEIVQLCFEVLDKFIYITPSNGLQGAVPSNQEYQGQPFLFLINELGSFSALHSTRDRWRKRMSHAIE